MDMCLHCTGLVIELNGVLYAHNSEIAITEVGEEDNALQCRTDSTTCCANDPMRGQRRGGEWHYPDNSLVDNDASGNDFYRTRGDMTVSLNRRNGATQPTGLYCCELPTAAHPNTNAKTCITLFYGTTQTTTTTVATTTDTFTPVIVIPAGIEIGQIATANQEL